MGFKLTQRVSGVADFKSFSAADLKICRSLFLGKLD